MFTGPITALLSLVLGLTDAPANQGSDCQAQVNQHFAAREFADAAAVAERCWDDTHDASFLYFAAQARVNLRHGAHAMIDLYRFDRAEAKAWRDPAVDEVVTAARDLVVSVEVAVTPTPSADGELAMVYLGDKRGVIQISGAELRDSESQVHLDPGRWRLAWRQDGKIVASREIETREGLSVILEIPQTPPVEDEPDVVEPTPPEPLEADLRRRQRRARIGVAASVGPAAGLAVGAGIGLVVHGAQIDLGKLGAGASEAENEAIYRPVVDRATFVWDGAVLLGAGLGGGAVVATELAKAPRPVLYAEVGAGAALAISGAAWSAVNAASYRKLTQDLYDHGQVPDNDAFTRADRGGIGSGLLLGLGSGLVTGAAISLISRAVAERRRRLCQVALFP